MVHERVTGLASMSTAGGNWPVPGRAAPTGSAFCQARIALARRHVGWLLVVLLWYAAPVRADDQPKPAPPDAGTARSLGQITADVQQTLRAEAMARSVGQRESAIRRLVELYVEAAGHEMFGTSSTLQRAAMRVRGRLRQIAHQLRSALHEPPVEPEQAQATGRRRGHIRPRHQVLAQRFGGNQPVAGAAAGAPVAVQPVPADNGPALVDLIERTISPAIWDVNGGPATVVYYAPGRALVVRAPGQTHRDVAQLVNAMRQADR